MRIRIRLATLMRMRIHNTARKGHSVCDIRFRNKLNINAHLEQIEKLDQAVRGHAVHGVQGLELGSLGGQVHRLVFGNQDLRWDLAALLVLFQLGEVHLQGKSFC
jgi:hypothetical protein